MRRQDRRAAAFARAVEALNGGDATAAMHVCRTLLQEAPEDPGALQLMAAAALTAGDHADAERWAAASLSVRPDHPATLVLAGQAARAAGDLDLALARFQRAAELDRDRPDAAFHACITRMEQGNIDIRPLVDDLLARFPDFARGWSDIGTFLERAGRVEAALVAYARAARSKPSAALHLRRGTLLKSLGRHGEAAAAFGEAVSMDPSSAPAWFKLGLALQDFRDPAGAIAAYRRALALQPDMAEAQANLGIVLQETGDLAAAKQAYGRAIRLRPDSFGRIAQALTMAPKGELWLDLAALRAHLSEEGRLSR
jgi:tetratricopeptide (TPR) repeat protein